MDKHERKKRTRTIKAWSATVQTKDSMPWTVNRGPQSGGKYIMHSLVDYGISTVIW